MREPRSPLAESAVLIHRPHPLIKESTFGFVFIQLLTLGFQNQMFAALEANDEIGAVLFHHAFEDVDDFKPKMIVLHPGIDIRVAVKLK